MRTLCQGRRFELCVACPHSRLLTAAPASLSCLPHPPCLSLLGLEGQGAGGTETLECWGCLDSYICVFAKEDRVGQGTCSRRPPH